VQISWRKNWIISLTLIVRCKGVRKECRGAGNGDLRRRLGKILTIPKSIRVRQITCDVNSGADPRPRKVARWAWVAGGVLSVRKFRNALSR
jgi:hypothetical protein